jgi:hypothetical protein
VGSFLMINVDWSIMMLLADELDEIAYVLINI